MPVLQSPISDVGRRLPGAALVEPPAGSPLAVADFDPLPASSRATLEALRDAAEAAQGNRLRLYDRQNALARDRVATTERIKVLSMPRGRGGWQLSENDPEGGDVAWPTTTLRCPTYSLRPTDVGHSRPLSLSADAFTSIEIVDVPALLAWANRDALLAAIEREIDLAAGAASVLGDALSDVDRASKLERLYGELLELERSEVAAARAVGATLRADSDPRAVLGIE